MSMKTLTCAATHRRLAAFHDRELSVDDQLAVAAHVDWCDACATALEAMVCVGAALRASSPGRVAVAAEELSTFPSAVVSRLKAERTVSWSFSLRAMFEDLHFVYAGGAAALAALVCVGVMLGTMKFVGTMRPDSLAALVDVLRPGSNQNPVVARANLQMPKPLDQEFAPLVKMEPDAEAVFALSATVTREGRVTHLALLSAGGEGHLLSEPVDARAIAGVLDVMSRARFEPGNVDGAPVAVNMVWLVARTTVRGGPHVSDRPTPAQPIDRRSPVPLTKAGRRLPNHA